MHKNTFWFILDLIFIYFTLIVTKTIVRPTLSLSNLPRTNQHYVSFHKKSSLKNIIYYA